MIAGGVFIVLLVGVLIFLNIRPSPKGQSATLTMWGTDGSMVWDSMIQAYQKLKPSVKVNYVTVGLENYNSLVLEALAAGQGPDVFYISNRELPKFWNIISPAPSTQFSLVQLKQYFPDVVRQDFSLNDQVYALPLYIDTLALIYNRSLLNQAGVSLPPLTWNEFLTDVPKLRSLNPSGQIFRAAAAIGGSKNSIDTASDILSLLMMQNGTQMTSSDHSVATFASPSQGDPGGTAFNFYLQFANAASPYYTWNDDEPPALDSFSGDKAVMIFNYHSALAQIKNKSPFLNFDVAKMPQPAGASYRIDYARYTGLSVSRQSRAPSAAWDFVMYLTTNTDNAKTYLASVNEPPALLSMIQEEMNDPEYSVFATQALTAQSWYEYNPDKISDVLSQAILSVLTGEASAAKALSQAQDQVSQIMRGL